MKKCLEGSHAVAKVVNCCKPDVVSAYPITPQTHIVEELALLKANGQADFEFVRADSEFAAASIVLGSSATGGRSYTATSSQGLMLMVEVLFSIAGMRKPVVMTCANRAISSPINIWNDQQDSLTVRDSGWIMFYAEDNQQAMDLHLFAFKIAEQLQIPAMVNMDGFVLTHTYETVDLPDQKQVDAFLPKYRAPKNSILDVNDPVTLGSFATPDDYQEIKMDLNKDLNNVKKIFKKEAKLFKQIFDRKYKLVDYYGVKNPDTIFVSFGSLIGTIKDSVDQLIEGKNKVGVCNIVCYRPFPEEEIIKCLSKAKKIIVLEKDISLGSGGILLSEVKKALYGNSKAKIFGKSIGLGGRDIKIKDILKIFKISK
jgi:pyruvate ferredoxin oxidoreductase alpha subunit